MGVNCSPMRMPTGSTLPSCNNIEVVDDGIARLNVHEGNHRLVLTERTAWHISPMT